MGPGILLHHPFGITVHPDAVIGEMVTLFKGSTIGRVRSGKRKGVPKIGDRVIISLNATVVGGITVGSDVLIAANSFVDFDVPDGSLVIGNPGKIVFRKNPVNDYIQ
jgi:serine O-acetyltransferase